MFDTSKNEACVWLIRCVVCSGLIGRSRGSARRSISRRVRKKRKRRKEEENTSEGRESQKKSGKTSKKSLLDVENDSTTSTKSM